MKKYYQHVMLNVVLFFLLSVSFGLAADKKQYPTTPPTQVSKKWRIGYYEAGAYHNYPKTLIAIVNGLAVLGWIEPVTIPFNEGDKTTDKLWLWLSTNIKSKYVEFPADAYYSYNWKKELREKTKQVALKRLKENRDIDLILAMGTWAGQDLANNEHSVPTLVCSTSDPVDSKIIRSNEDSGYDHVHAHVDPTRYIRQIEAFHDVFDFKRLGVTFINTDYGRSYAAIEDIRKIAKQRKFEITECHTLPGTLTPEVATSVIKCAQDIAPKIDAFYLTQQVGVNNETLPKILAVMNAKKVPIFSQAGSDEVRRGVLLSIATPDFKLFGKFHAETIAKVFNGAKPRELNQIFELPAKIAFNKAAARSVDIRDDIYHLLLKTADEVYEKIE